MADSRGSGAGSEAGSGGPDGTAGGPGGTAGGSLAGGRYQVLSPLGEGGMARVHLAYDTALDRQVAIKTLHTELGREPSFRERFRREAQAVAKLSHPHIVAVYDTGEDSLVPGAAPMPYIVMEYVEGDSLSAVLHDDIERYGAMPAERALKVTAEVLSALEASHESGLVHRDIKPGNVMVTRRGDIKVMDFGIARAVQSGVTSMTQTGMVVGTPQYLSPEQALGRSVDARADLYSVGVMLFQLLTGRLPFEGDSPLSIAYAHVQREALAPSGVNRSVTPAMDALVARALRKNPNERFPSAATMREECARVAAAGRTPPPAIVPGAALPSGAGVSAAVFPPVGADGGGGPVGAGGTPVGAGGGSGATGAPGAPAAGIPGQGMGGGYAAYPPGPYGPPAPAPGPAPVPSYGYPAGPGYGPPSAPAARAFSYTVSPAPRPAPRRSPTRRRASLLALVFLLVILAIVAAQGLLRTGDDRDGGPGTSEDAAGNGSGAGQKGGGSAVIAPDRTRTIDPQRCAEAMEDTSDPAKVLAPDLRYKDLLSVKECLRAAGWTWKVTEVENTQWPRDAVIEQYPGKGVAVTPEDQEYELKVSTGRSSGS
ncbi:protein kinase [Streptomyces sp. NPDC057638]|uniref:protein kinase domain-containing protein n=1 Tax=Streptomyces sp. NPDC057638 TaxID=3346190 RepID=UPI00368459E4